MDSWWQLGEGYGHKGNELALSRITCPFCMESGNFKTVFHADKKKPNSRKKLNFDTLECGNCKGYVMVVWSACEFPPNVGIHDYRVIPRPLKLDRWPEHWPDDIGRFWLQAKRSLLNENWDAAVLMTRSALQIAIRSHGASGQNLKQEINDLANEGKLPPIMKDWSDHVRELGNESAHPKPSGVPTNPQDAKDIVRFLDFLLECLYTLPHRIQEYRRRGQSDSE